MMKKLRGRKMSKGDLWLRLEVSLHDAHRVTRAKVPMQAINASTVSRRAGTLRYLIRARINNNLDRRTRL